MFGAGNYSCLVAKFHLKRSISFHLLQNYLPSILIGTVLSPQLKFYCTDKKENQIFLIYKEIQNGAFAKSYMTNGPAHILGNICAFPHIQEALPHDFATAPLQIPLYLEKILFSF
jgi:hypothetical protein